MDSTWLSIGVLILLSTELCRCKENSTMDHPESHKRVKRCETIPILVQPYISQMETFLLQFWASSILWSSTTMSVMPPKPQNKGFVTLAANVTIWGVKPAVPVPWGSGFVVSVSKSCLTDFLAFFMPWKCDFFSWVLVWLFEEWRPGGVLFPKSKIPSSWGKSSHLPLQHFYQLAIYLPN